MFNTYPYTDFHEINLDWFLMQFKELVDDWESYRNDLTAQWEAFTADLTAQWEQVSQDWETLYNYVHDYFDNLDVQSEIDNKLNEMSADGSLLTIIRPTVTTAAGNWLEENLTSTSPPVDSTLTISGAAADAKITGDRLTDLAEDFNGIISLDIVPISYIRSDAANSRINYTNGNIVSGTNFSITEFIDISNYTKLSYKDMALTTSTTTTGMAFYDEDYTYINGYPASTGYEGLHYLDELKTVMIPPTAKYARFTMFTTSAYGNFKVYGESKTINQIKTIGSNLTIAKGSILGGVFVNSGYNAYLKVEGGSTIEITAINNATPFGALRSLTLPVVAGETPDFSQVSGWTAAKAVNANETYSGIIPSDAEWIYFYKGTNSVDRLPAKVKLNGIEITDISGTITDNINILADKINKLSGSIDDRSSKRIAFFGDSLVAGSGVTGEADSQLFHQYLHDIYGYTCLNYGYGGSGYIRNTDDVGGFIGLGESGKGAILSNANKLTNNTVLDRLQDASSTSFDCVVIFAGINDYAHQDEYPYADFVARLDATFAYYQSNYNRTPLLVMLPTHRYNDNVTSETRPKTLIEYCDAIISKCREYGIPYADTLTYSGLNPNNANNRTLFYTRDDTGELDIVHPNHYGHQRIERVIGEMVNQLILWNTFAVR